MGKVKIRLPYFPFEKYIEEKELINELRGRMLTEAIREMKRTREKCVVVKCPCCGRLIKISLEEVDRSD